MSKGLSKCFISLIVFKLKLMIGFLVLEIASVEPHSFIVDRPSQPVRLHAR